MIPELVIGILDGITGTKMKGSFFLILIALIAILVFPSMPGNPAYVSASEPTEITELRTRTSKTYDLGNNKRAVTIGQESKHYLADEYDINSGWLEIDTTIWPSLKPAWDYEVEKNNYKIYIRNDTTTAFVKDGNWIGFIYEGFTYYDKSTQEYEVLDTRNNVTPVVTGNKIRWNNIFYGSDLEYIITNDTFKENLYISQEARDWLENHPPSSYGLNNQDTYLTGFIRCDWSSAYTAEDKDGYINYNDYESESEPIYWLHPITSEIVAGLPLGYTMHDQVNPDDWATIRHRFFRHDNGNNYLLFGAKVTALNQYPDGTIILDPTIEAQIDTGTDDVSAREGNSSIYDGTRTYFGRDTSFNSRWHGGYLFPDVTIPNGVTIDTAYIIFEAYSSDSGTNQCIIAGEDTSTPATYSTYADFMGRTLTTANVSWQPDAWVADSDYNTDEIKTIVQELEDSYDYSGGLDMAFQIRFVGNPGTETVRAAESYDGDTPNCPTLHIEYTAGGVSPPTVVSVSSSVVEETSANCSANITATAANCTSVFIQYGYNSGNYTANVTDNGSFGVGSFNLELTGLTPGAAVYWRGGATNAGGTGYGSELSFNTKPEAVTGASVDSQGDTWIYTSWTPGQGSENTTIRYDTSGYPGGYDQGTLGYSGNGTTANMTGLSPGQIYYIEYYAVDTDNGTVYSDIAAQVTDYTLPGAPSNLIADNTTCNSMDVEWTAGTGSNQSVLRYKIGSYPTSYTDGALGYQGSSNYTNVSSLNSSTAYYWAVWAYDSDSGYYSSGSAQVTGNTTAAADPTVTTDNATSISDTSAQLNATISGLDCANVTDIAFEWGIASGNYTDNWTDSVNYGNVSFFYVPSLSENTTYYYRGYARIGGGAWQYGSEISFTTEPAAVSVTSTGMIPSERDIPSYDAQDIFILVYPGILLVLLALWKRHPVIFILSGATIVFIGMFWYDQYGTSAGLSTGMSFIMLGLACWGYAFKEMLYSSRQGV